MVAKEKKGSVLTPHAVEISPEAWVLPNRVEFPVWMADTFKYDPQAHDDKGLYVHQRFVRDYLQPASPYRGLLLYHGLGVGKTCASIAVADVLRPPSVSSGKVYIMLPAFLRGNFLKEVRKCGDPRFIPEQSWRKTQSNGKGKGKGKVVFETAPIADGGSPFLEFSPEDRDLIKAQIDLDILDAYTVIHYNGLSTKSVNALSSGAVNIFNNSVVIIDEAPNVIGQVMHGKMLGHLYQRIMDADRCKVVLLSGTPLVNTPLELAYIANLTHGYIRELIFSGIPSSVDVLSLETTLSENPHVDHVSSKVLVDGSLVTVTLIPSGFVKVQDGNKDRVAVKAAPDAPGPDALTELLRAAASAAAGVPLKEPTKQNRYLIPVDPDKFNSAFVDDPLDVFQVGRKNQQERPPSVLNPEVLVRRVLGTVSVYSSTDPALMPTILPAKIIRVPMSDHQYEEYLLQRDIERRKERAAARYAAVAGDGRSDSKNLYRAFSRSICTFVFPVEIKRPYRKDLFKVLDAKDKAGAEAEEGTEEGTETGAEASVHGSDIGEGDDEGEYGQMDRTVVVKKVNRAYDDALEAAMALMYASRVRLLSITGELPKLSPKYAEILLHLLAAENSRRPAIIYSQFRRVEGLGLLRMTLIANGFAELKVSTKRGTLIAEVVPADSKPDAPRFIVYGNDDPDAAAAMLEVFNSQLSSLPVSLSTSLKAVLEGQPGVLEGDEGNRHGAIARLLLITQSGSEGISTQNVREVHIIEPFWHANRILQVVGRAARTKSHADLPPEERTVEVYVYAATFTESQADNVTIIKLDKQRTSDEHILAVATQKRLLLDRFTDVLRRAAVDCVIHHPRSAVRRCFSHNAATLKKGGGALAFHTDLDVDIATQGRHIRLVPFEMEDGREGLADPVTGDVYDKTTHAQAGKFLRIGQRRPSSVVRRMNARGR